MKKSSTQLYSKTKPAHKEEPSQKTLDFLMLFARSFVTENKTSTPLDQVCLN